MLQRLEGAAIEQAGFDISEVPLHFSFRLSRQLRAVAICRTKPFG
jgi:hypothetical protein